MRLGKICAICYLTGASVSTVYMDEALSILGNLGWYFSRYKWNLDLVICKYSCIYYLEL